MPRARAIGIVVARQMRRLLLKLFYLTRSSNLMTSSLAAVATRRLARDLPSSRWRRRRWRICFFVFSRVFAFVVATAAVVVSMRRCACAFHSLIDAANRRFCDGKRDRQRFAASNGARTFLWPLAGIFKKRFAFAPRSSPLQICARALNHPLLFVVVGGGVCARARFRIKNARRRTATSELINSEQASVQFASFVVLMTHCLVLFFFCCATSSCLVCPFAC